MLKKALFSLIISVLVLLSISFVDLYCTHTSFKLFKVWLVEFNEINNYLIFINDFIINLLIVFLIISLIVYFIKIKNSFIYIALVLLCISLGNFFMKTSINLTMDSRKEVLSGNLVDKSLAFLLMHKKVQCED
ncbi:hypothetical protein [Acinetobacter nosocomialis]|uniref:hypothetical protein n=1 Tax=Acinetobacter nosocomialis TaxID=106654 RepID=UPI001ADD3C31|nr:hypothetical protein [Acinetobacter nosocomialis]MBO8209025.1 hypothetical protein [Acinetobacter nosocomialis]MBO8225476.1 hypothetical protein [Acinetobacter nosocomialis]MBO8249215.1 hypothetical protein [Acinetobacter nosocomialis]